MYFLPHSFCQLRWFQYCRIVSERQEIIRNPFQCRMAYFHVDNFLNAVNAELCNAEPLVAGGYATYKLVDLLIANRENNYLL